MRYCTAIMIGALALSTPSLAHADWSVIFATPEYFVEFDPRLVRVQPPYAMAWTRMTFTNPQRIQGTEGARHQSQLQLHAIDCATFASTIVGIVYYSGAMAQGSVVERSTRPRGEWVPKAMPADSLGGSAIKLACAELERRGTPR